MGDEDLVKVFSEMCEKGNLDEVKKMLDLHDIESLFPRYDRSDCPLCICIENKQNHILLELLDRGFKMKGLCYEEGYICTSSKIVQSKNKEAMIMFLMRGLDLYPDENVEDLIDYYSPVTTLLVDIIKDAYEESFVKPVKK